MFDLRYHVASLAAVFFALVIGILVGVALASHGLGNTERKRLDRQIDAANARAADAEDRVATLTEEGEANSAFVKQAYEAVVADRLRGRRIAILFIGNVDRPLLSSINSTLNDAGAPPQRRLRAMTVPIDDAALDRILRRRKQLASYAGSSNLGNLGRELAREFVVGGDTPLWDALENTLVEEKGGGMGRPVDGVVVVRNVPPQLDGTAAFLSGVYSGLADARVPIVGVESSDTRPSAVPVFQEYSLSSVDDVDKKVGRVALAVVLSGAADGSYGIKDTADAVLPEITPVLPSGTGG